MKIAKQLLLGVMAGLLIITLALGREKAAVTAPGPTVVHQAKFPVTLKGGEYDLHKIIVDFPREVTGPE